MVVSKELASAISKSGETFIKDIGHVLDIAKELSPPAEFEQLKKAIANVLGTIEVDLLGPLYHMHPDFEPEYMKGWENES